MRLRGKTRAAAEEYVTMAKRSVGLREKTTKAIHCLRSLRCGPLGLATKTMSVARWFASFTDRYALFGCRNAEEEQVEGCKWRPGAIGNSGWKLVGEAVGTGTRERWRRGQLDMSSGSIGSSSS
ncbi:hypothetical protein PanWU01x14_172330 [Parasponia andersonii]|uniref:Uncharacterized protein n=1 Tax=Parasponia andersonii TaxID=3476 RepID=A0A2P5C9L6_PARAD|nr:hypothetical protein PanWU01x14_172330 [Parasponia andersonii]